VSKTFVQINLSDARGCMWRPVLLNKDSRAETGVFTSGSEDDYQTLLIGLLEIIARETKQ
jgi:hypothetical protein